MCDVAIALTVASIGTSLFGMRQQQQAMKRQQALEQQRLALQQKQFQQQAEGEALAMQQKITQRKRIAAEEYASNYNTLAGTNIDINSPSFGAFFKSNVEAKKRDIRNLKLQGTERQLNALYGAQQTQIASDASASAYKSSRQALVTDALGTSFGTLASLDFDALGKKLGS